MRAEPLPYLDTFSKAAELSSFTQAAKALGMTQAAVSQRIQTLEKDLDTSLFRRQGGKILLTNAGRELHSYAQRIAGLYQEARQRITRQKPIVAGILTLGASTIPGEHLLPAFLSRFRKRYPHVQVKAIIGDSMAILNEVETGKVQIGLVGRKSDSPHLKFQPLAKDRLVLVVPKRHSWSRRRKVSLKQLCQQPLVLREVGSGLRHCFEKSLERAGKSLHDFQVAVELGSNEAIKEAVLRGVGIAILSIHAVHKEIKSRRLAALEVTDLRCDREMFIVRDKRRVISGPAMTFLSFLESNPTRSLQP